MKDLLVKKVGGEHRLGIGLVGSVSASETSSEFNTVAGGGGGRLKGEWGCRMVHG